MADYSANLTPIYRISKFLDRLVHGTDAPEPIYRIEFYLAKLAGQDVEIPEPIYRIEFYLAKLCGMDVEIPVPIYRAEFYLAKLCGEEVTPPEVIYRISHWLADWAESGGGGELPDGFTRIPGIKLSSARFVIPDFYLTGDDTLRFSARGKAGNWIGCFNFTAAENNYSFYAGTNSTSKYARYNGQQGGSAIYVDTWYDVVMSPTGVEGVRNPSSFTPSSFVCTEPLCIGATSRDGSVCSAVDFRGDIMVGRRLKLIPVERENDGVIGLHDGTTFHEPIEGTVTRLEDEAVSFGPANTASGLMMAAPESEDGGAADGS